MVLIAFLLLVCSAFAATLQPNGTISIGQPTNITLAANQYTWLTINLNSVGVNQGLRIDVQEGDSVAMVFRWTTDFDSDDNLRDQADGLLYEYNFGNSFSSVNTLIIPTCGFVSVAPNNKNGNLIFKSSFGSSSTVTVTTLTEPCTSTTWSSTTEFYAIAPYSWTYVDVPFSLNSGSSLRWDLKNENGGFSGANPYTSYLLSEYPDITYPTGSSTFEAVYIVKPQMTIRLGIWNDASSAANVSVSYTLTPATCYVMACTGSDSDAEDCEEVSTCVGAKEYEAFPFENFFDPRDGFFPLIFLAIQGSAKCRQGLANQMCVAAYTPCDENNFLRPLCAQPFCNDLSGCTFKPAVGDTSQTITYPNFNSNMTQCLAYLNRGQGEDIGLPETTSSSPAGRSPPMNFVDETEFADCYVPPNARVNSAFSRGVNRLLIGASILSLLLLSLF